MRAGRNCTDPVHSSHASLHPLSCWRERQSPQSDQAFDLPQEDISLSLLKVATMAGGPPEQESSRSWEEGLGCGCMACHMSHGQLAVSLLTPQMYLMAPGSKGLLPLSEPRGWAGTRGASHTEVLLQVSLPSVHSIGCPSRRLRLRFSL